MAVSEPILKTSKNMEWFHRVLPLPQNGCRCTQNRDYYIYVNPNKTVKTRGACQIFVDW